MVIALILCVVVVAWPLTFIAVSFTALTENMTDDKRFQQRIDAEIAEKEAEKADPPMDAPATKTKSKV